MDNISTHTTEQPRSKCWQGGHARVTIHVASPIVSVAVASFECGSNNMCTRVVLVCTQVVYPQYARVGVGCAQYQSAQLHKIQCFYPVQKQLSTDSITGNAKAAISPENRYRVVAGTADQVHGRATSMEAVRHTLVCMQRSLTAMCGRYTPERDVDKERMDSAKQRAIQYDISTSATAQSLASHSARLPGTCNLNSTRRHSS